MPTRPVSEYQKLILEGYNSRHFRSVFGVVGKPWGQQYYRVERREETNPQLLLLYGVQKACEQYETDSQSCLRPRKHLLLVKQILETLKS